MKSQRFNGTVLHGGVNWNSEFLRNEGSKTYLFKSEFLRYEGSKNYLFNSEFLCNKITSPFCFSFTQRPTFISIHDFKHSSEDNKTNSLWSEYLKRFNAYSREHILALIQFFPLFLFLELCIFVQIAAKLLHKCFLMS